MVHGRSYWELPEDILATVVRPLNENVDADEAARQREKIEATEKAKQAQVAAADDVNDNASKLLAAMEKDVVSITDRISQAVKRKASEMKTIDKIKKKEEELHPDIAPNNTSTYLEMVKKLQNVDKETDSTGGKWLVR